MSVGKYMNRDDTIPIPDDEKNLEPRHISQDAEISIFRDNKIEIPIYVAT